jgi:hypothetical protein
MFGDGDRRKPSINTQAIRKGRRIATTRTETVAIEDMIKQFGASFSG